MCLQKKSEDVFVWPGCTVVRAPRAARSGEGRTREVRKNTKNFRERTLTHEDRRSDPKYRNPHSLRNRTFLSAPHLHLQRSEAVFAIGSITHTSRCNVFKLSTSPSHISLLVPSLKTKRSVSCSASISSISRPFPLQ